MSDLWALMLLFLYLEDSERFERPQTEKVRTHYYEFPECGRRWGDEYSAPRFCPNCGMAPRKTFEQVEVMARTQVKYPCNCARCSNEQHGSRLQSGEKKPPQMFQQNGCTLMGLCEVQPTDEWERKHYGNKMGVRFAL